MGDALSAIAQLSLAHSLNPALSKSSVMTLAKLLCVEAAHLLELRMYTEALWRLDGAVKAAKDYAPALYYRGLAFLGLRKLPEAAAALAAFCNTDSSQSKVYLLLGRIYIAMGSTAAATHCISNAVALTPEDLEAQAAYAELKKGASDLLASGTQVT